VLSLILTFNSSLEIIGFFWLYFYVYFKAFILFLNKKIPYIYKLTILMCICKQFFHMKGIKLKIFVLSTKLAFVKVCKLWSNTLSLTLILMVTFKPEKKNPYIYKETILMSILMFTTLAFSVQYMLNIHKTSLCKFWNLFLLIN